MDESTEVKKCWGCKCCDGKNENCGCLCHKFSRYYLLKAILMLVILALVFSAGVGIGKLSSRRDNDWGAYGRYKNRDGYHMMPYQTDGNIPMMYQRFRQQPNQQSATSTTSTSSPEQQ